MLTLLKVSIGLVQVFDVAIHVASGQVEALRISSNTIILLWLIATSAREVQGRRVLIAALAIVAYLGLNGIFLALEGFTNASQGGAPRTMLFLLVSTTFLLSTVLSIVFVGADRHRKAS